MLPVAAEETAAPPVVADEAAAPTQVADNAAVTHSWKRRRRRRRRKKTFCIPLGPEAVPEPPKLIALPRDFDLFIKKKESGCEDWRLKFGLL
ncbi:hypothetical protein Q8A67_006541 [Cirrhinus molitorella]|uniref:Uncharacterized protein n=1 Tax=Cirrhinus molitorella TaxID=172907 RepID=A0AA88Q2B7_9TELE|nr:hypothetical protein Q8A67_006541 [Cirrhinus molitorella]